MMSEPPRWMRLSKAVDVLKDIAFFVNLSFMKSVLVPPVVNTEIGGILHVALTADSSPQACGSTGYS